MDTAKMKSFSNKISFPLICMLVLALMLSLAGKVLAQAPEPPPQLPSSFYGEVLITDPAPSAGDLITVFRGTTQVASTKIVTYQGGLVYSVDVPGVISDEGTDLIFKLGDRVVATAVWESGSNKGLDLVTSPYEVNYQIFLPFIKN